MLHYAHEDTDKLAGANVYNGQNSVLWCNFRDAFPDKIQETYQDLRSNGVLNYDELIDQFITKGSDKWSESIYNEDADFKYISMLYTDGDASNLGQVRGTGEEHLRYFIENRLNYCDGKWYASDYADDYIALRIYTPDTWAGVEPNADITVTPYSHMYAGVRYKANGNLYQKRVSANEVTTFEAPDETFNDTETAIYGASQLSSLGDLSPLYCGSINVAKAEKLTELIIGSNVEGYSNPNLNDLSVGTNDLLRILNVRNCPNLTDPLALAGCPNIEEIYAAGSGITGIELANSGYLKTIELPATITNLSLMNQIYIENFTIEGYDSIKTLRIENCPIIDTLDLLTKATNVERVRFTDVDWTYDTVDGVLALADRDLAGIDENGANIDYMWIDGKCHIKELTGAEYLEVKAVFPYMTITYDVLTSELIYMSEDGKTELARQTVQNGGDGVYSGTTPTKASTAQYTYTFAGWSLTPGGSADPNAIKSVEADRVVYAAFSSELRKYTVRFYNGSTLLQTVNNVPYGGSASYTGSTPTNNSTGNTADFEFYGWSPAPTNIKGDTNCYAQYHDLREITDSWATIKANADNGTAVTKYGVGAFKTLEIGEKDLPYEFYRGSAVVYNNEIHILGSNSYNTSHYKWNGTEWTSVSTLPYAFYRGSAVVFNDEIHILGSADSSNTKRHYKWNGTSWVSVSTLPYELYTGAALVYNDEIHIIGSESTGSRTKHYKWDGAEWTSVSTLPYDFYQGCAVVYNNEIHILGTSTAICRKYHYKWNGTEWVSVSTLPYSFYYGSAAVYNNEIHILGSADSSNTKRHYKWDGSSWTSVSTLPYIFNQSSAVVYNNEIHILGGNSNKYGFYHYSTETGTWSKYVTDSIPMQLVAHNHDNLPDGVGKWESMGQLPYEFYEGGVVVYNDEIHILGCGRSGHYTKHYKWDGSSWTSVSTLPYEFYYGSAVVYNNEIHIMGSDNSSYYTKHYKWNGTEWTSVSTLPYDFSYSSAVVYNNEIHILGSYDSSYNQYHYKWNGTEWTSVSTLPYKFRSGSAVVCNNELHILGGNADSMYTKYHYKWNGSSWVSVSTLPYKFYYGSAVVYNNEIYIMGSDDSSNYKSHYKWTGAEWTSVSTLPYNLRHASVIVYDNDIHILGSYNSSNYKSHFKFITARTEWQSLGQLPYDFSSGSAVVYNNEIHILGSYNNKTKHYKWNGTEWTSVSTLPYSFNNGYAVDYNNEIHILGGSSGALNHYKWNGTEWTSVSTLPHTFRYASAVIYNNEIHILGSNDSSNQTKHYKWNGTEWTSVSTLPYNFRDGYAVVYNNEIHIMGSLSYTKNHYKWNGTEWIKVSTLPYGFYTGSAVVYNNEIHILGSNDNATVDTYHYKWNGTEWTSVSTLPYEFYYGSAVVYNNEIRILGSSSSYRRSHYTLTTIRPKATLTFLANKLLSETRHMNNYQTNVNGWSAMELRQYLNSDFLATLPSELQTAIVEVEKISDAGYIDGSSGSLASTNDKVWILSADEIGETSDTYNIVHGQGDVYPCFTDGSSRLFSTVSGQPGSYWLRTSNYSNVMRFYNQDASASILNSKVITDKYYILIGFCM